IDEMVQVSDHDAFHAARELARREGLLVGGSSGAVICALRQVAPDLGPNARVAILFPDSASRYLSTIFNDDWMKEKGLL
ncbi:MAG TPA: pyridoxal-phosphate dependent enzyme, partial [Thermoanaerobaculia bacterium]